MLNDIEEFFEKIKEIKESEEFKKTKEILDLIDTVNEIMKRYYDIINPKPKVGVSDNTKDLLYFDRKLIDSCIVIQCKHAWVLKHSHTGGEDYQCHKCGTWKTVNWNDTASWFDVEYYYNDKALGC